MNKCKARERCAQVYTSTILKPITTTDHIPYRAALIVKAQAQTRTTLADPSPLRATPGPSADCHDIDNPPVIASEDLECETLPTKDFLKKYMAIISMVMHLQSVGQMTQLSLYYPSWMMVQAVIYWRMTSRLSLGFQRHL